MTHPVYFSLLNSIIFILKTGGPRLIVNAEELIRMAHRRLCGQAHEEARKIMAAIRDNVALIDPDLASLMVSLCVYRNGLCDELPRTCGFNKTIKIITDV